MKLYNSIGPNPRLVRLFLAEKGIELDKAEIDLMSGENRKAPYTDINPSGQLPCLVLDDGTAIAETIAICEYFEEKNPTPALIGSTPEERALARMWTRRVEQKVVTPLTDAFRSAEGAALFKDRMRIIPQAADDLKAMAQDGLAFLDANMAGDFIAGSRFTIADITLFSFLEFGAQVGQPIDPAHGNVAKWFERVKQRPSVAASA